MGFSPLRSPRRIKPGWPILILLLAGINGYLFFIRGIPGGGETGEPAPNADSATEVPPTPVPEPPAPARPDARPEGTAEFQSALGEMRGVAGVRAQTAEPQAPGQHRSPLRFDLEEAQGVAGQRTLEQWCVRLEGAVERGENFSTALTHRGVDPDRVADLVQALKKIFDFRRVKEGEHFSMLRSPGGRIERFVYQVTPLLSYRVERRGTALFGRKIEERADVELSSIAIRIDDSLYVSMEAAGETAALVMLIVDIFSWDIDFYTDTRKGDTIRLLVEKNRLNGKFVRYGKILAAEYRGGVGVHRAFWYETKKGEAGFYDEDGGSLRKAFLKSPLKFVRVTSGFGRRVHPILGYSGMHRGIDFGAPAGTPVWAPADGWVRSAGPKGGAGNMIQLKHANGYETIYMHLQSISRGIRAGERVRQKQVIGYVGSTGLSTGPHLHYEMHRNGQAVSSLRQTFPPADPVPKAELDNYQKAISPQKEKLLAIPLPLAARTAAVRDSGQGAG